VIVHVTVPGRPAMGTIASAKVWSTKCAQITSVSNTFSVDFFITMHVRLNVHLVQSVCNTDKANQCSLRSFVVEF